MVDFNGNKFIFLATVFLLCSCHSLLPLDIMKVVTNIKREIKQICTQKYKLEEFFWQYEIQIILKQMKYMKYPNFIDCIFFLCIYCMGSTEHFCIFKFFILNINSNDLCGPKCSCYLQATEVNGSIRITKHRKQISGQK